LPEIDGARTGSLACLTFSFDQFLADLRAGISLGLRANGNACSGEKQNASIGDGSFSNFEVLCKQKMIGTAALH
jgi:hypothetical protein